MLPNVGSARATTRRIFGSAEGDQIPKSPTPSRAVQALNNADRGFEELMKSFFAHFDGAKNILLAYREAFDYEAINKLSRPKKLQLRHFRTEKRVSFNLPEGTHASAVMQSLFLSPPSFLNPALPPLPSFSFPLNTVPPGNFPILPLSQSALPSAQQATP